MNEYTGLAGEQSINGLQKVIEACEDENNLLGARADYLLKRLDQYSDDGDSSEFKRLMEIMRDNAQIIRAYSEELAIREVES